MTTDSIHKTISTSEFFYFLSSLNKDELLALIGSDLSQVHFREYINLSNLNVSKAIFDQTDLYKAEITNCQFTNASLKAVNLSRSILTNVDFANADLSRM